MDTWTAISLVHINWRTQVSLEKLIPGYFELFKFIYYITFITIQFIMKLFSRYVPQLFLYSYYYSSILYVLFFSPGCVKSLC